MLNDLVKFFDDHFKQANRFVPARLQAALALCERLRDEPALSLDEHKKSNSTGIVSHETYGKRAHARLNLELLNTTHGRRSNNIGGWGQPFLDLLRSMGFSDASSKARAKILDIAQQHLAQLIQGILDQEPLTVRVKGRSAHSIVSELLDQAEPKGKTGALAQYLIGAKLQLRFNRDIPVVPYNKKDRISRSDTRAKTGDFEIENSTIEVAVGLPDEKHILQLCDALKDKELELWLLTRQTRLLTWQQAIEEIDDIDTSRIVLCSVEAFVGQNITELGMFSSKGKSEQLQALFNLYNERWIEKLGPPGLRIVVK